MVAMYHCRGVFDSFGIQNFLYQTWHQNRMFWWLSRRDSFQPIIFRPKLRNVKLNDTRSNHISFEDILLPVPERDPENLHIAEVNEITRHVVIEPPEQQAAPPKFIGSEGHFQSEVINRLIIQYVRMSCDQIYTPFYHRSSWLLGTWWKCLARESYRYWFLTWPPFAMLVQFESLEGTWSRISLSYGAVIATQSLPTKLYQCII